MEELFSGAMCPGLKLACLVCKGSEIHMFDSGVDSKHVFWMDAFWEKSRRKPGPSMTVAKGK